MNNCVPSRDTIVCAAIEIADADERAAFVARASGADVDLRRRVEALVAAHFQAGSFLEAPAEAPATMAPLTTPPDEVGAMIGPYKLLEQIGEGGMGVVYVAEQTDPVRRRVALKVIKPGMDSREVVARFEAERQALALMDHPNIAHVFDAGTTAAGRPYFVMELVRGLPITEYCDQARLSAEQRLRLFALVCRAVQHAHQKGVIHRDLKPSNVLVTLHDGTPMPKVIDFGVAKAINQRLTDKSVYTRFTQLVGTPLYMSPEQAELSALDVDTRSDVYSLGVLLYELLTGTTPFDAETLRDASFDEMRRIIREDEPPRPSARLSTLDAAARSTVSSKRGLDNRQLSRLLRGDLDWIVMKALEKDRNRRYESAGTFAADIERYLTDEPVEARPPTVGYRVRKFARRNRAAVLVGAVITAVMMLGTVGTSVGMVWALRAEGFASRAADDEARHRLEAESQRDQAVAAKARADQEAAIAKAVNDFIRKVLAEAAPEKNPRGRRVSVEEVVGRAAARIDTDFAGQPLVEAAIRLTIGETYLQLGNHEVAAKHLERATVIRTREFGEEHPDTLEALLSQAELFRARGQFDQAESLMSKTLAMCRQKIGKDHETTINGINNLALLYVERNQHAKAEPLYREALETSRRVRGESHLDTLMLMYSLASMLLDRGQQSEAESLYVKVLDLARRDHGTDNVATVATTHGLAMLYDSRSDYVRADRLFREALELSRRFLGDEHPGTLIVLTNVAAGYVRRKEYAHAEPFLVQAVEVGRRVLGEDHPDFIQHMEWLGTAYALQDKHALAAPILAKVLEARRRNDGKKKSATFGILEAFENVTFRDMLVASIDGMNNLATKYQADRKPDLALPLLEEALRIQKVHVGSDHPDTLVTMNNLAIVYDSVGRIELGLPLHEETLRLRTAKLGSNHPDTLASMNDLAVAYWNVKWFDKSIPLFEETLARREAKLGRDHRDTVTTGANLGVNYKDAGRLREALPLLEAGHRAGKHYPRLQWIATQLLDGYVKSGMAAETVALVNQLQADARAKMPGDSPALAGQLAPFGLALLRVKAFVDAEPILRECFAIREYAQRDDWVTFNTQSMLGEALLGQKKFADAEPLLLQGYKGLKDREASIPPAAKERLAETIDRVVRLYEDTNRVDEARVWRAKLPPEFRRRPREGAGK